MLLRPAVPGPRRGPDPALHLHPGDAHGRIGARRPGAGAGPGCARHRPHRRHRPTSAAAAAAPGRVRASDRAVRGGDPVHRRRHRRDRRRGGPVHGARRLRRRPDAGRDRVPQGHRDHHRAVQGPAARHLLLHRRHGRRRARAGARAAVALRLGGRAGRHQGGADHRPRPAVPRAPAGGDRNRAAAGPRRRVRLRRPRPGRDAGLLSPASPASCWPSPRSPWR